jgi:hypothetical protein
MERAPREDPADEVFGFGYRRLYEDGLRLLGALGTAPAFPTDVAGVEALIAGVVAGEAEERIRIAAEAPDELPRYSGEHLLWVAPLGDGNVRLRAEEYGLAAVAARLAPDGSFSKFERQQGFGVADGDLTPRARADRGQVERRMREDEAAAVESRRHTEEERGRFRTSGLRGVSAAPWQDPAGLVITWVAFYEPGFIVSYLLPAGSDEHWPGLGISDDLGNSYRLVGIEREGVPGLARRRGSLSFAPGVAAESTRLLVRGDSGVVDVEVLR